MVAIHSQLSLISLRGYEYSLHQIKLRIFSIKKIVLETLPANITPAQLHGNEALGQPTILRHIVSQALSPSKALPSMTIKNPMIELGRTLVAILRHLRRPDADQDVDTLMRHVFHTPVIARPIARLVRQRFYAEARSEGLLGLGIMAQSHDGAVCVVEELNNDAGLLGAIKEIAVGRDSQNAVVLLHGLVTNGVCGNLCCLVWQRGAN